MGVFLSLVLGLFAGSTLEAAYYVAPGWQRRESRHVGKAIRHASIARRWRCDKNPDSSFCAAARITCGRPWSSVAQDSGTQAAPIVWQAYGDEQPVISGGVKLEALDWQPYRDGIFQAKVPSDLRTEEIFVNGERQILARYPNFDPSAQYFDGFAADAISKERVARWADPTGGYFHAMHPALWGDFTWRITGKDDQGGVTMEGGWQNNRGGAVHQKIRFVENIFEELDAPGEWFLDAKTHTLYFYPPTGLDLASATVEATRLRSLVEFRGSEEQPVRFVTLRGLTFRHAARTVMDTREPIDALGLGDLSRRRDLLRGRGGLRAGGQLPGSGRRQRGFRQPLQPPDHRARLPDRQGRGQRDLLCRRPAGDAQSVVQLRPGEPARGSRPHARSDAATIIPRTAWWTIA